MGASALFTNMAQRTPAKPISRLRSLLMAAELFLRSGRASRQWPDLASSSACFAFEEGPPAFGLEACLAESGCACRQINTQVNPRRESLNIEKGKRRGTLAP